MIEFIITLVVLIIFVSAMSVGLLVQKPLKGSGGGINCGCKNECE